MFAPVYDAYTTFVDTADYIVCKFICAGRPCLMRPEDCLRLYLTWSRTCGSLAVLQLLLGQTFTAVAKYIQFDFRNVIKILKQDPMTKIAMLFHTKLEEYHAMIEIERHHHTFPDVWRIWMASRLKFMKHLMTSPSHISTMALHRLSIYIGLLSIYLK